MWSKLRPALVAVAVFVAGTAAGLAITSVIATARFRTRFEEEKAELLRRGRAAPPSTVALAPDLPPPVRRYLEVAGAAGKPRLRVATIRQTGSIRTAADAPWMPFESEQAYAMDPPGFVWLARARVAPLVHMMARDRFVDGRGNMLIRLLGVLTVADATGPELDQGAGIRHWGEVFAFPEEVASPYVRWEPVDGRNARWTARQGELSITGTVEFDEAGLPAATHAQRYYSGPDGKPVLMPWSGYSSAWRTIDGRLFPSRWEAVWHLPAGDFLAVRMQIEGLHAE